MHEQQPVAATHLSNWDTLPAFKDKHAGPFTGSSIDWIVKHHRTELIEMGVLITRRGRGGSLVDVARFGGALTAILKRESLERARAVGAA